jgi:twitching motility protein PilU
MGTMERILRLMAEKKASDVYLSAHSPALLRINGQCVPINNQPLPAEAPRALLAEIVPENRLSELDSYNELNMGFPIDGVGRFRLSAMRQRGSIAAVIRFVSGEIPSLASLTLPPVLGDLIMEKRGLLLMVGATGMGKSTSLAAMLDYRNENASGHILTIEDPIEFLFKNKRSVVNQREIGADTKNLQTAPQNALRQAPDVILIGDPRARDHVRRHRLRPVRPPVPATMHANNSSRRSTAS